MSAPETRAIKPRWGRIAGACAILALAVVLIVRLIGSGDDADADAAPNGDDWAGLANAYCADGIQEASALTLPSSADEVAADASDRIQIVAAVRDGVYTLGTPDDVDPDQVDAYLASLDDDLTALDEIRSAARSGGDYQSLVAGFNESSGQIASDLGLDDCASFAQSIARTP